MKKRYGNRQNMMEVFVAFAVPQCFFGLLFKLLDLWRKVLFILAVSLREFPHVQAVRSCSASTPE